MVPAHDDIAEVLESFLSSLLGKQRGGRRARAVLHCPVALAPHAAVTPQASTRAKG
jgi:hypothetical protein